MVTFRATAEMTDRVLDTYRGFRRAGMRDLFLGSRAVEEGTEYVLVSTWDSVNDMEQAIAEADATVGWPSTTRIIEVFDLAWRRTFPTPLPSVIRVYRGVLGEAMLDRVGEYAERDIDLLASNPSCDFVAAGVRPPGDAVVVTLSADRRGVEARTNELWRWNWLWAPTEALEYEVLTSTVGPE
jgi:hypothetical protein